MKLALFALCAVFACTMAAPAEEPEVTVVRSENTVEPDGSYTYLYELSDGTSKTEQGKAFNAGTDDAYVEVSGSYKYLDPEGQLIEVAYTADRRGFVPEGAQIPAEITENARKLVAAAV